MNNLKNTLLFYSSGGTQGNGATAVKHVTTVLLVSSKEKSRASESPKAQKNY